MEVQGRRLRIRGIVQGVGFRPFVYGLARRFGLAGTVWNDGEGVVVELEGPAEDLDRFAAALHGAAPPLARIDAVEAGTFAPRGGDVFRIAHSREGRKATMVAPDAATCADCLAELFDPADRRYRYPFINCTHCGPRFSIVIDVPYDRERTTMAAFEMCPACLDEYEDPGDRRFHAQPNACPACGPRITLAAPGSGVGADGPGGAAPSRGGSGAACTGDAALEAAVAALREGALLAIKGLGGYHLACRADDGDVVARLRRAKVRAEKPFALMVADLRHAGELVEVDAEEAKLLGGPAAPILLARRRPGAAVAAALAPRCRELGVMLAYTPLHHLLLADLDGIPLVMTSGNRSDEPIAYEDDEAEARLGPMVDLLLTHDRVIRTRVEDSVARVVSIGRRRRPMLLRRSRGYAPASIPLPVPLLRPTLGCGAERKTACAIGVDTTTWVGPHVGDLRDYDALRSYRESIARMARLFPPDPRVAARDAHPEYLSTKEAAARGEATVVVQHHHAHLAACLAEHGEVGPALGAVFDGAGYGLDGSVWGGEFLLGDLASFRRVGRLWPVRMPGGDAAVREPWRMACAWLIASGVDVSAVPKRLADLVDAARWRGVARMTHAGVRSPTTTSVGRLFDAVAALAGVRAEVSYEGQAAIELEAAIRSGSAGDGYPLPALEDAEGLLLDARPTVAAVARDADEGVDTGSIAARFHTAMTVATARACQVLARAHGVATVVLSGGVFQNVRLLEGVAARLQAAGLRVLVPSALPPNDGGIAYGQLAVAAGGGRVGAADHAGAAHRLDGGPR
ncbi:MAG TPA: carbamoyltransferase HypF [Longimicrobiales bacterium]|nr:carbamoyltransferase HypF [Longimicrobiales bacterium]